MATEEVRRIREALLTVEAHVRKLEHACGRDLETLAAQKQKEAVEREAAEAEQQLAQAYTAALARCDAEDGEEAAAATELRGALAAASEEEVAQRARHAALAQELSALQAYNPAALMLLRQRVAAAEEQARIAEEQAAARGAAEHELRRRRAWAAEARAGHARAEAELGALLQAARRAEDDVQRAQQAGSGEGVAAGLRLAVESLQEEAEAQRLALSSGAERAEACGARLAELRRLQRELTAARAGAERAQDRIVQRQLGPAAQPGVLASRLAALRQHQQLLAGRVQGAAAQLGAGPPGATARPLHSCFAFRDPGACRPYALALDALAGSVGCTLGGVL